MKRSGFAKIVSLFIAVVMIAGMIPFSVFAEDAITYPGWDTDSFDMEMDTETNTVLSWMYDGELPGCTGDVIPYEAELYVWTGTGTMPETDFWIMTIPTLSAWGGNYEGSLYWVTDSTPEPTLQEGDVCSYQIEILSTNGYNVVMRSPALSFAVSEGSGGGNTPDPETLPGLDNTTYQWHKGSSSGITFTKYDYGWTFVSLEIGGTTLTQGADYTMATETAWWDETLQYQKVTVSPSFLETLGYGDNEIICRYAETNAGQPVFSSGSKIVIQGEMCSPALTVTGYDGADITDGCEIVWYKSNGSRIYEPISVTSGTTLTYTVTPTAALEIKGEQYYDEATGEVTLTQAAQSVNVALDQYGSVTVVPTTAGGDPIPNDYDAGYTVTWYSSGTVNTLRAAGGGGYMNYVGDGVTSPKVPVGTTLYCDITMTGDNAETYPYNAEKYPVSVGFANSEETVTFTAAQTASPALTVTGYMGEDVTDKCTVVWRDDRGNALEAPFTVITGKTVYYTVTPTDALMIDGVQYYTAVSGSVQLLSENQKVNAALGQTGFVKVILTDENGDAVPYYDENEYQNFNVTWYGENGRYIGEGEESRVRETGEKLSAYISIYNTVSEKYYNPEDKLEFTTGFGRTEVEYKLTRKVPELPFYEIERRISYNEPVCFYRTDNGYTFDSIWYGDTKLEYDRDYQQWGTETWLRPQMITGLGVGTHVFRFHYAETTDEKDLDTRMTVTVTPGDITEVRYQARMNSGYSPTFYYSGEPFTFSPLLYAGNWSNDDRRGMLYEGRDYVLSFENNVNASTDDNPAKVIITGIGNYSGTRTEAFKIKPCEINTGYADFEVVPNWDWPYLYDGEPKDMTDVSVYSRGRLLVEGVDYEVYHQTWNGMKEEVSSRVGSPTETTYIPIEIHGLGNYTQYWDSSRTYADEAKYRIMPHVDETVSGRLVLNAGTLDEIVWSWELDPEGNLTVDGEGEMPEGFPSAYWVGGSDPDHYYIYGWRNGYTDMIKRAVITGDVTSIEENAFWNCTNLVDVTIPETVVTIGGSAFYSCRSLRSVHAPGSNRLPESVRTVNDAIYQSAFGGNTYNLELHLSDNITDYRGRTPASGKLYCRYGTTTHETLKAIGIDHIVEGYDNYVVQYKDNYNLGGTYTVCGYVGHGGEERLPDFIDSITHYDIFGQAASLITKLTIPGNIRVLNGDAFRFLDNCKEIIIEPGEMESLIGGLLNGHGDTRLTIPDTVTTLPDGDFSYFYYTNVVTVGEGSPALDWAIAQGYQPDDGSNYGRLYKIANNTQPYIRPLTASVPINALTDVTTTKSDGMYTFDSLKYGDETLIPGEDYTLDGNNITIKEQWLAKVGVGVHNVVLHYVADESIEIPPKDPVMKITVLGFCSPVLTVYGVDGADITDECTVVWKNGNKVIDQPVSVLESTTLSYTVTPNDSLMIDGVQYYVPFTGTVTFTETVQEVEAELGRRGAVTVNIVTELPDGYNVTWYDENGRRIETGFDSPVADEGKTLYYAVTMTGENAEDYYSVDMTRLTVTFGPRTEDVTITPKNNLKINVSGKKRTGDDISSADYTVYWYVKDENGEFVYTGTTGDKLKNLEGQNGKEYYYEIAPHDRYLTSWTRIYNWLEFRGVPLSVDNKFTVTDKPQSVDVTLETMATATLKGTVSNIGNIGKDNVNIAITVAPWSGYASGASGFNYCDTDKELGAAATASIKADGTFEATVYDCALMIKLTDKAENFNALYRSVSQTELSAPLTLDMEARPLPETLFLNIKCVYPLYCAANTSSRELYYGSEYSQGDFNNMIFTLYNDTKGITVDPALYTVTPTKLNFADTAALAGIIDMGDMLTLTASFNGDAQAAFNVNTDTIQVSHRYSGYSDTRFDFSYTEYGRIYIDTERKGGYYPEIYAVYNAEGELEYTGKIGTTGKLADGEYTVIVLRENNWFNAPATLTELYDLLDPTEYQISTCAVTKGYLTRLHFGVSPAAAERVLFDEDSGLNDLAVNSVAKEWVLVKLPYAVNKDLAATNPGRTYAITVTTYTGGFGDTPVTVRYESGHLFGEAAKDKYISLYAKDKLTESAVKINYLDANHLGTVHGFTLYTTETKGDIYFYVQADFAGTFNVTANGAMLRANGSVAKSAALGSMTLTAVTGNTALNFSSDYLRTSGNGQARFNYNTVWLYTEPYTDVTLYMDDVAIAKKRSVDFGLATFSFAMNNEYVGSARTSLFKAQQRDWTLAGFHELYAETENGIRTPTVIMECLTEEQFTPAVISSLDVSTYMDDGKYLSNRTLFSDRYLTNNYFSPYDTGNIFKYDFKATVESPDNVDYLYVLVYDNNGVEYAAKLEREANKNTFVGTIEGERLLFTSWAIILRSKDPDPTVNTAFLSDDIVSLLGEDTVITDPNGSNSTVKAEYERALAEAQAMAEDGSLETEMSFYFDVYADLINEISKYYKEEGFTLDNSEESINEMLEFFGYTIGTAADVDYQSWGYDYVSAYLPDGREMRARVTFEEQKDGGWLYTAETVILPTYDDPDGYSQVQRVYYETGDAPNGGSPKPYSMRRNGLPVIRMETTANLLPTYDRDATAALQNLKNRLTKAYQNIANRQESGRDALHWNKRMEAMEQLNRSQNQHAVQTRTNLSIQARLADLRDLGPEKLGSDNYNKVVSCLDKLNRICDAASVSDIGTALSKAINAAMNCTITGRLSKMLLDMSKGYLAEKFEEKFGYEMPTSILGAGDLLARLYFAKMLSEEEAELFELLMELDRLANALGAKGNLFDAGNLKITGGGNARAITDPQGIVYEAVLSNPVEGATATIWERNTETGEQTVWNAEDYGQTNPQITNASGMYQWFVPEGEWQVRITAPEGYTDNTSAAHPAANLDDGSAAGWLPVMPVQMGINIPLVSTASPEVAKVTVYEDRAEIEFSLYMDVSTLSAITISDGENIVPCTLTFPDKDVDPADDTRYYAKTVVLTPENGEFDADGTYTVSIQSGVTAYNGKALSAEYVSAGLSVTDPHTHQLEYVPAKDASCTENGNKAYYVCSVCGKWFEDADAAVRIDDKASVTVYASGHKPANAVRENEVEAKCETNGSYDEVIYCSVCHKELSREHKTILASGHKPANAVRENEVEAKCETNGSYDEVVYCSVCHKELSREHKTIQAAGHKYGEPVWKWSDEHDFAKAEFKCGECGGVKTVDATVTGAEADGKMIYTAKVEFNGKTYTDVYEKSLAPEFVPGDINGDGSVDNKDVVALFRYTSGGDAKVNEIALDVNGDGFVDNKDVVVLFRFVSGGGVKLSDKPYTPKLSTITILPQISR